MERTGWSLRSHVATIDSETWLVSHHPALASLGHPSSRGGEYDPISTFRKPATFHGLNTYAGAVVFCPFSQQLPRKFGRYGFVILLLPFGIAPTLAPPLIRASTRS